MTFKDDTKLMNDISNSTVKCKCGHSMLIPNYLSKRLCTWCHRWVYRNKKEEFKEKIKVQLRKRDYNEKK